LSTEHSEDSIDTVSRLCLSRVTGYSDLLFILPPTFGRNILQLHTLYNVSRVEWKV